MAFQPRTREDAAASTVRRGWGAAFGFPGRGPAARRDRQAGGKRRRGTALVEGSIVLSLFFLFVLAMIEMSRMGMANQMLTHAARAGARVAVIPGNTAADVTTSVQGTMNSAGITVYDLTITPSDPTTATLGQPVTVSVSTAFSNISWLARPLYLGSVTLSASSTLSSEHP